MNLIKWWYVSICCMCVKVAIGNNGNGRLIVTVKSGGSCEQLENFTNEVAKPDCFTSYVFCHNVLGLHSQKHEQLLLTQTLGDRTTINNEGVA